MPVTKIPESGGKIVRDSIDVGRKSLSGAFSRLPGADGSFEKITDHIGRLHFKTFIPVAVWTVELANGGYILIDSGYFNCNVERGLEKAGFSEPPEALVITHCHLDHTGTAKRLIDWWNIPVVASEIESPYIEGWKSLSEAVGSTAQKAFLGLSDKLNMMTGAPVQVNRKVSEGDLVGGLRVVDVRGHSPGQIALIHEQDRAVLVADTFGNFRNRIGRWPFPGIDTDRDEGMRSIVKMADLKYEKFLPSHGVPILSDGPERLRAAFNLN